MRKFATAALLGLCCVASAGEPDGAVAAPARWTGPNGPASNSRRSSAMPVTRDVVEAWSVELPGIAVSPPVTWDGRAYVTCQARRGVTLVAIDIATGEIAGKKMFTKAPQAPIHVWADVVYLRTSETVVSGYKLAGRSFVQRTKLDLPEPPQGMAVLENEIYVVAGGKLTRAAPGLKSKVWEVGDGMLGQPAVYGNAVLVVGRSGTRRFSGVSLQAYSRREGKVLGSCTIANMSSRVGPAEVTVGGRRVLVRSPFAIPTNNGHATHAFITRQSDGKNVRLKFDGLWSFKLRPAVYKHGLVSCDGEEWQWWTDRGGLPLASRRTRPDLFRFPVPATVLGDVVYFGTWAADVETGEVLWRLPVAAVSFGAVPVDRLVLVVQSGSMFAAYRSRVGGSR
jgi:hypothetical protein